MVYIHGGGWVIGDKREQGKPMMYELVARGWVCVAINYRLSPKATWPDHIVDAKRAVAWVKEHIADVRGRSRPSSRSAGGRPAATCARCWLSARGTPRSSRGSRSADTVRAGLRALLRRHGPDRLARGLGPLRAGPARAAREQGHEDPGVRAPRGVPRTRPPPTGSIPGHRRSSSCTASTTPWCPSRRRAPSWSGCGRCRASRWPTPNSPWPSTLSTSWPRCAARPPPRPSPTSSKRRRAACNPE